MSSHFSGSKGASVCFQTLAHRHAYPRLWLDDDGLLILLRYQHTGGEGRLDHVDHQVIGQDVQLLHLVARHVGAAGDAVTEQTRKTEEIESTIFPKPTAHWVWERFFFKKNRGTLNLEKIWLPLEKKKNSTIEKQQQQNATTHEEIVETGHSCTGGCLLGVLTGLLRSTDESHWASNKTASQS